MEETDRQQLVDFNDTEIAFSNKSNKELKRTARLFKLMNNRHLVGVGSSLGLLATRWRLPLSERIFEKTIYYQFCGGKTLLDCQPVIDKLYQHRTLTVLDFGAEGKNKEEHYDAVAAEIGKAIQFAASNASVPVVSLKPTALASNDLLAKWQSENELTDVERMEFGRVVDRLDSICKSARDLGVKVFIDAEESWMQDAIDYLVEMMMGRYNRETAAVYNTYQLYRHDKLEDLKQAYSKARKEGYILGAKLVRGAYMNKERERAEEMGYPSPIQPNKEATDRDYNEAIRFCVDNYETLASCNACHNRTSNRLQAEMIAERDIQRDHPNLNFCQLLGMSDAITFNLAEAGFNVAKYVVYGPVKEVVPYLIRRAHENTSVTGDMSRELQLVMTEMARRGMQ